MITMTDNRNRTGRAMTDFNIEQGTIRGTETLGLHRVSRHPLRRTAGGGIAVPAPIRTDPHGRACGTAAAFTSAPAPRGLSFDKTLRQRFAAGEGDLGGGAAIVHRLQDF